jgi:hypothetical protein
VMNVADLRASTDPGLDYSYVVRCVLDTCLLGAGSPAFHIRDGRGRAGPAGERAQV